VFTGAALAEAVEQTTTWAVVIPPRGHDRSAMSRNPRGHGAWAEPTLVLLLDAAFVRSYRENRP
jgi:hypothetical protein